MDPRWDSPRDPEPGQPPRAPIPDEPSDRVLLAFGYLVVVIVIALVAQFAGRALLVLVSPAAWSGGAPPGALPSSRLLGSPLQVLVFALARQLTCAVGAMIASRRRNQSLAVSLGMVRGKLPWSLHPLGALAVYGLLAADFAVVFPFLGDGSAPKLGPTLTAAMNTLVTAPLPWAVALIAAQGMLPALGEELLFRGYLQRRLLERWRPAVAIGLTSAVFALFHGARALLVFPESLWLGYLAWRTGSIVPSMICHAAIDGGIALIVRLSGQPLDSDAFGPYDRPPWLMVAGIGLVGAIVFVASLWIIERAARRVPKTPINAD